MARDERSVTLYALSTCVWCKKTVAWLDERGVRYNRIYVDLLSGAEHDAVLDEIQKFTTRVAYPILVVDGGRTVIQGYKPEQFEEELG